MCDLDSILLVCLWDSHELGNDFDHKEDCTNVLQLENQIILDREFEGSEVHRHKAGVCNDDEHQTVEIRDESILRVDEEVFLPALLLLIFLIVIFGRVILVICHPVSLLFLLV